MRIAWLGLAVAVLFAACAQDAETIVPTSSSSSGGSGGTGAAEGGGGGAPQPCGSASVNLEAAGLLELTQDDGTPYSSVRQQDIAITSVSTNFTYVLNDWPLQESVRFELEHPARIHGFQVMWADVPDDGDPATELAAGLYADFGYNGFDFWAADPLWEGTRCASDIDDTGAWTTYAFDAPIDIAKPGLVHVAHRSAPSAPTWWFDETTADGDNPCATFDLCQSSFNLPTVEYAVLYHGLSFSFQNHFMVRLFIEYLDDVQPADKLFQRDDLVPEGAHPSWGDYDDDGYDDLLVDAKLYKNNGDGTFTDVTSIVNASMTGGVWGDYDNDGCLDLFGFVEGYVIADVLLHNDCNGGFDVAQDTGIVDFQSYNDCGDPNNTASPSAAAAWVDIDADGFLDLYLANFLCWAENSFYTDTVFLNDGDGTFTEATSSFSDTLRSPSRTVAPIDADGDGDMDIYVGNYRLEANLFWRNNGDGTLDQVAGAVGLAGDLVGGYYGHTIGIAWGDLDNDGDFDNVTANLAHPRFFGFSDKTQVLINDGAGNFTDNSGDWTYPASDNGLRYQETHSVPVLGDYDHNGTLDLAITAVYDGRPTDFYWGNGDGTFELDAYHAGITTENGWGIATADYDNDGDLDIYATGLFKNTGTTGASWLQTRVVGVTANQAGIGAVVKVTAAGVTRIRHVQGGSGKGGQDTMFLNFGLGDASTVDEIRVVFPGGAEVVYAGPIAVDQRVWLVQDSVVARPGWTRP